LTACAKETPVATETPVVVESTAAPVAEEPCLIIGATYGGPVNDAGYNQAMHEGVMKIKENIPCVKIIEAENVYDEAGATATIEQMIQQGAKMIIATAFSHQQPAFDLATKYPDVIFEHAGGWMMGANFANFYGKPPDVWYLQGVAAGMMTKTNKLGFVAAFPLGWTLTFANAFQLGAVSVNPDAVTEVKFTYAWGDSTKEAEVTNALINNGADVITMHVDSPATVLSTAESRGVYSIGFQSLAAQQFAPKYWIVGSGFTLGDKLTWLTSTVLDKTWKPIFLRCSLSEGCMALSDFGPEVPQEVKDKVAQTLKDLDAGTIVTFAGPIKDQDGNVVVKEGEVLTDDQMSSVTWLVQGMIGSPK
ncbi:MAG: BMP family ABC transporter substrate-binding protein, partial [Anaerolineaceae bacterium]